MFEYYIGLALRSLLRSKVLTALMVLAIGVGIGASMTMITVLHVMSDDPMPGRSGRLFYPHLNPLPVHTNVSVDAPDPTDNLTWPDAMALLKSHMGARQAAMAGGALLARPTDTGVHPFPVSGRYTTSDFFAMFGVPFLSGTGWSSRDDDQQAREVVLSDSLNRQFFGDHKSIGKSIRLGDYDFRIIGITADWKPQPLFYVDQSEHAFGTGDQFFLPLATAEMLNLDTSGNTSSWGSSPAEQMHTSSTTSWLQFWVQLDTPAQISAYRQYLFDYSAQQKALGRFQWLPSEAKLYSLMQWLDHKNLVPADIRLQLWLALGFLCVCMMNIVALLLAKFLRRSREISVRRALGARRADIFLQLGVESALIGLAGGVLGLLIAQAGLWAIRTRPDDYAQLATMDMTMLVGTFVLAVAASVIAGLIPAWRACCVTPVLQLKTH